MLREPVGRQAGHGLQRSGLFKQMGGTGNDGQVGGPGHVRGGAPVEGQHLFVARAHQQQGGALHPRKITGRGEIRAPAAGDHGPYACALRGSSTQGRRSTGAGTEIPHGQQCRCGLAPGPIGHIQQALREKRDVKPRGIDTVFLWREQIDQQGRQAAFSQHPRHMVVAGAVAAAAAAVCKQHQALAVGRAIQRAGAQWLYLLPDTFLGTVYGRVTPAALQLKLPSFGAAELAVRSGGALLGLVSRYWSVGQLAGAKAAQILVEGKAPAQVPVETLKRFSLLVNMRVAHSLHLYPPIDMLNYAEVIAVGDGASPAS